ncbi:Acetyltransferase (GNAT) family protein [Edaphobacillus lindanitolerans]|uniref:Acetyltransferase (GNAT) family protein n=2 Tax=Edaphobacillus lindanitolerans TaxID=550447 RepID=A0A1U7PSX7_9BACI|nr:Acetyltransferase (GNAT) family protein [Edaphobacillus lindanitolerans]
MQLQVKGMEEDFAKEILGWRYEEPYDFYNNEATEEEIAELLDGSYRVLLNEGAVFGFFCTGASARIPAGEQQGVYGENVLDMGLGMSPDHTGKGLGYDFCSFIMDYISERNQGMAIRLSVAAFNKRAIRLYENLGFSVRDRFATDTAEFMTMVKEAGQIKYKG